MKQLAHPQASRAFIC